MLVVYKYIMEGIEPVYNFDIPIGAKIVDVGLQERDGVFWMLVNNTKPTEERRFIQVITGEDIENYSINDLDPVGTYINAFRQVIHVFEIQKKDEE